ncbi:hypothetical protein Tco_0136362, partial [Tanacetum coccineum]
IPTPDVTVVEVTSPCSLSTLGALASVSLYVCSKLVVDEDSWTTFSDYYQGGVRPCSSITIAFPFTSGSLCISSATRLRIATPPTGQHQHLHLLLFLDAHPNSTSWPVQEQDHHLILEVPVLVELHLLHQQAKAFPCELFLRK